MEAGGPPKEASGRRFAREVNGMPLDAHRGGATTITQLLGRRGRTVGSSAPQVVMLQSSNRTGPAGQNSPSLRIGKTYLKSYLVLGRFPAELGPETRSNGSGLKNGAKRTQNQPRRPIRSPIA